MISTIVKIGFVGFIVLLGYAVYFSLKKYWGSTRRQSDNSILVPDIMVQPAAEKQISASTLTVETNANLAEQGKEN